MNTEASVFSCILHMLAPNTWRKSLLNRSWSKKSNRGVINLCLHFHFNTQHIWLQFLLTFIKLFQSHSSNIQGLCYEKPICCFIWKFCVQTAIHLPQYTPVTFFMPQYLERQSNQPQKGMVSHVQQTQTPLKIKNAHMLCV